MDLGRLSRRCLFVASFACLWIAALDALPTEGPFSADQEEQLRPHWRYSRDSNPTLGNTTTTWAVVCVYPISGIYTQMQRLLFYIITAFVFLLRSYDWLIAVGMTFVLTYASAACIHAFLLSTLHGIGPDVDVLAVQTIIMSTTMAICCYSISSRRISDFAIAPLFYGWISAMLVTSLVICFSSNGLLGDLTTYIVPAVCSGDGECSPGACSIATSHGLFRSEMEQLVPIALERWTHYNASIQRGWDGYSHAHPYTPFYAYYFLITVLVVIRLAVSPLLFNSSKIRNVVFFHFLVTFKNSRRSSHLRLGSLFIESRLSRRMFMGVNTHPRSRKLMESILLYDLSTASEVKPWPIYVAKLSASCWFVCSWLARIILLMLPVTTVVLLELILVGLPESEAPRLVGQWSRFVYVGLALLASLILKFLNYFRRIGVQKQRRIIYLSYPDSTEPLQSPLRRLTEEHERKLHLDPYSTVREFKTWWNDPVSVSKQDYEDVRRLLRFELVAARRRAAKRRQKGSSCEVEDDAAVPADTGPFKTPEFDRIWERLSASANESQSHEIWSTQIPSTFAICRGNKHRNSLADTGWITATYEEEYETIPTAEMKRREAKARKDREDREQLADSLETFIGDIVELGGFELR